MTSNPDTPMLSVEPTTTLVLYNPVDFDVVMKEDGEAQIPTGIVSVDNPPPWLVTLHQQLTTAHNHLREIAVTVGQEQIHELASLKEQYEVLKKKLHHRHQPLRSRIRGLAKPDHPPRTAGPTGQLPLRF
ncbi:hypothetical protein B0H65DRAFT_467992 [Neurospora tetraspora]|uniref:Uncharacterized protein n=1 Tax=Neurospora tetraspora TaxID=94610 RepID=A0AAE0JBW6_9PEZI|nr:hypothetical protein B0H65DRAFT_467992 [Neurospora tetraspora]